jgi:hypothetical protein
MNQFFADRIGTGEEFQMVGNQRQAGVLTYEQAVELAAAEILNWAQTDDWRARAPARRIFSIYDRVRKVSN